MKRRPGCATVTSYEKLPPGDTVTLDGETLTTRSGPPEPPTVTLTPVEQLLLVLDSPRDRVDAETTVEGAGGILG